MGNLTIIDHIPEQAASEADSALMKAKAANPVQFGKQSFHSDRSNPIGTYEAPQAAPAPRYFPADHVVQVGSLTMTAKQAYDQGLLDTTQREGKTVYYDPSSREPSSTGDEKEGDLLPPSHEEEVTPDSMAEALADPATEALIEGIAQAVGPGNLMSSATQALQGVGNETTMRRLGEQMGFTPDDGNDPAEAARQTFSDIYDGLAVKASEYLEKNSGGGVKGQDIMDWADSHLSEGEKFEAQIAVFNGNMKALDKVISRYRAGNPLAG